MLVKTGQLGAAGARELCAGASVGGAAPTADVLLGPDSVERAQPTAAKASTSRPAGARSLIMAASIMRLDAWTRVIPSRFPVPGRPVAVGPASAWAAGLRLPLASRAAPSIRGPDRRQPGPGRGRQGHPIRAGA